MKTLRRNWVSLHAATVLRGPKFQFRGRGIQNPADALSLKRKLFRGNRTWTLTSSFQASPWSRSASSPSHRSGRFYSFCESAPIATRREELLRTATLRLNGTEKETPMRGIILWLLGVPVVVIILLYVFHVL